MATYYVSATTGNDSNNGESVATAKATIGAGENLATSAGDIVYIAPGNYRETVTHGYSGNNNNRIYFIGDPDCEIFTTISPGVVRITRASDSNELAAGNTGTTSGPVIRTNGKDYITWKNVHVDGNSSGVSSRTDSNTSYGFYANSTADYLETINCMAQSIDEGFRNVQNIDNCVAWNVESGFSYCANVDRSLAFGCYYGARNCTGTIKNSILHGHWVCAYYCTTVINSILFGGYYQTLGFGNADFINDSMFLGGRHAIGAFNTTDTSQIICSGSYVAGSYVLNRFGKIHGLGWGFLQLYQWVSTPVVGRNGSTNMTSDGLLFEQKGMTLWSMNDARKVIEGFKPSLFTKAIQGCTTEQFNTTAGATDIFGNPRIMGSTRDIFMEGSDHVTSSRDIGPFEFSNVSVTGSVSSSQPGFSVTDEGIFRIPITVSASSSVTASIGLRHNAGSGTAVKPQFQLRFSETNATASNVSAFTTTANQELLSGSNLTIQSVTSTAADNVFETISVSGSFDKQHELELLFINQQTGSDSISTFSDLEIT